MALYIYIQVLSQPSSNFQNCTLFEFNVYTNFISSLSSGASLLLDIILDKHLPLAFGQTCCTSSWVCYLFTWKIIFIPE